MTTANRIDPRGSGLYLTFDSPSDFLAALGGRENPCTAIFRPRDYPTNYVDPSGLEQSGAILTGTGYWKTYMPPDWHGVAVPDPAKLSGALLIEGGTSTQFVTALEESTDYFVYDGHHFGGGKILLKDGYFNIKDLLSRAKKLPRYVFLDACNTKSALPEKGKYPKTTFYGFNDYLQITDSLTAAVAAAKAFTPQGFASKFFDHTEQFLKSLPPGAPEVTVVK